MVSNFNIDGIEFVIDPRPGAQRGVSSENRFILVKSDNCLNFYREWAYEKPKTIMEVGMFEGGSLVLLDKLFHPERLVGLDLRREPIMPLEKYREDKPHIKTYYGRSQAEHGTLMAARENFVNTGIDLVVDDASHLYAQTKSTFEMLFPMVKAGGHYLIEDWAWSFGPRYQDQNAVWSNQDAMSNLILELVILAGSLGVVDKVHIQRELVCITKGRGRLPENPFDFTKILRGRSFSKI